MGVYDIKEYVCHANIMYLLKSTDANMYFIFLVELKIFKNKAPYFVFAIVCYIYFKVFIFIAGQKGANLIVDTYNKETPR
jgi:hypothetical protein